MRHSRFCLMAVLLCFAFVLGGCSTVFAPKDGSSGRGSGGGLFSSSSGSSGSSGSSNKNTNGTTTPSKPELSPDEQKIMDEYERIQKAEAQRNLGNAYLRGGKYGAAVAEFKAALLLVPRDYDLMYDIGLVYLMWNNPEEAIPYFENCLKLNDDYGPAINSLGNAYLMLGEYDKAISYFQKINETILYATPHMPLTNMGLAYYKKGDYVKAEQCYREALKIEPDFVNALVLLGELQLQKGSAREALRNLQRAVRLDDSAVVQYYLGLAYVANGDRANAAKMFENILNTTKSDLEVYLRAEEELEKLTMM